MRPITLPQNMSEVAIGPHAQVSTRPAGTDALRARYGITRQVQLGLTYVLGGRLRRSADDEHRRRSASTPARRSGSTSRC